MGAQSTKQDEAMVGHLTPDEVITLRKLFNTFHTQVATVGVKGEKTLCIGHHDFQRHCETYLHDWLAARVAEKLAVTCPRQEEQLIPITNYLSFVSDMLKGTLDEKVSVIWSLVVPTPLSTSTTTSTSASGQRERDTVTAMELVQYIRSIIESYMKCVEHSPTYQSWIDAEIGHQLTADSITDLAEHLLSDLLHHKVSNKELIKQESFVKESFSKEDLEKCFTNSALLQQLHASVTSTCFDLDVDTYFVQLLPTCIKAQPAFLPEHYSVLDHSRIMFLNTNLPFDLRSTWRFLFSTTAHGESFAKMVGQIESKGPTIIIIKDDGGRIFGAFATHNWEFGPKFFGDKNSFLFHLSPKFAAYPSTGYNENFQYFNVQQQTFPNGMGLGGKLDYFAIWLDAEFGKGKSSPSCTTYHCPQMASSEEFSIHHIEIWGVGPEPMKENERGERSILDKDAEAKALLELVDRGSVSEKMGVREPTNRDD